MFTSATTANRSIIIYSMAVKSSKPTNIIFEFSLFFATLKALNKNISDASNMPALLFSYNS